MTRVRFRENYAISFCPGCTYELKGLPPAGRCPECGRHYDRSMLWVPITVSSREPTFSIVPVIALVLLVCCLRTLALVLLAIIAIAWLVRVLVPRWNPRRQIRGIYLDSQGFCIGRPDQVASLVKWREIRRVGLCRTVYPIWNDRQGRALWRIRLKKRFLASWFTSLYEIHLRATRSDAVRITAMINGYRRRCKITFRTLAHRDTSEAPRPPAALP
jgi:hypothetical protein